MKWNNKSILLTGAAGFIGQNLLRRLIALNASVVVLDNFSFAKRTNLSFFSGRLIEEDVSNPKLCKRIKGDFDFIFHFGSPSSVILFNQNPERMIRETISGFANVIEMAKKAQVKKLVFPSSGSVYGTASPPQSESTVVKPVNLYAIAKLTCEMIANFNSPNVESVGLRIFAGYGQGEGHKGVIASPVTLFLSSMRKKQRPLIYGDGSQSRDFVYIDDVVLSILRAAERNVPPIINVGTGASHTFNEIVGILNSRLNASVKPKYIRKPPSYLERTLADTTLLEKTLGVKPVSLERGIEMYLESSG